MSDHGFDRTARECGEDAAPYVLGALTEEEHASFLVHLESCAICRDEITALQSVVSALPAAVPQMSAPSELKDRVMGTVRSEASLRGAADSPRRREPRRRPAPRLGMRGLLAGAGALAAAIIAVVVLSGGSSHRTTRLIQAQVTLPHASVSVQLSGGHAQLNLARMPQSPPNHVYEVWIKKAGAPQPTDALFTVSSAGNATVGVPGSIAGVKQILVTAEPAGGSKVPTSAPVIVANLS